MFCFKCGAKINEDMDYCPKCGESIDHKVYNNNGEKHEDDASVGVKETNEKEIIDKENNLEEALTEEEKVKNDVERGAIRYKVNAFIDSFPGTLSLTNYNSIYFIGSQGRKETVLLSTDIKDLNRVGSCLVFEMKNGEKIEIEVVKESIANSFMRKSKWALNDTEVVVDDYEGAYSEEDVLESASKKKKFTNSVLVIMVILFAITIVWRLIGNDEKKEENQAVSVTEESQVSKGDALAAADDFGATKMGGVPYDTFYYDEDESYYYFKYVMKPDGWKPQTMVFICKVSKETGEASIK